MTLFGIRYHGSPGGVENVINGIQVTIEGDIVYLSNSDKQPLEVNIRDMERIIQFLNKISNVVHSFEDVITTPRTKYIEKTGQHYGARPNECSAYLEALAKGGQCWKAKFFTIRDNFLLYFKDDSACKPEGVIPLEQSNITLSQEYQNCLEVATPQRRYHLRTKNNDEVVMWLKNLQEASKLTIDSLYEIKETIGQGSFAKVKRGIERSTGKEFAIKIINKDNVDQRESIMTEITILKNVSHPNIMKLHHVFESSHGIYLVTELLEGGELFDLIAARGFLTEAETSKIMRKVVQAIAYLHMKNVCHRDLKPENILLGTKGDIESVRITDFGLSKITDQNVLKTACGTPSYVAPEILSGCHYGFEVDMWSCGVILYVLICGFPPFYTDNDADLYALIQSGSYSFPSPYWDDISDITKDLIQRLLVVEPSKRLTPVQVLLHPFITNHRSLSFNRGIRRELSSYLVTQKKLKKSVGGDPLKNC
jgi:tRNA A-37 threonylcarbamoyl transferase component Bud32